MSGAAKYEVYRARSKSGDYIKYATVTGTSYTNTSYIENGNTYYYKVRALDANGTAGAWSSVVSVTYKQTLPAPTVTGGNDAQGRPTLKWNAVTGAAKYEVYRARRMDGVHQVFYRHRHQLHQHQLHRKRRHLLLQGPRFGCQRHGGRVEQHRVRDLPSKLCPPHRHWRQRRAGPSDPEMEGRHRRGQVRGVPRPQQGAVTTSSTATVTGTSYTNISYIENGNTYYYKVRALDANGTAGAWSSIVSVTYQPKQTLSAPYRHRRQRRAGPSRR